MSISNYQTDLDFNIEPGSLKFLESIVECQKKAFPSYFSTLLGDRFLKSLIRYYAKHPDGIMFVATLSSGDVVGIVSGGKPELRRIFSRRQIFFLIFDIVIAAVKHKRVRIRLTQHLIDMAKKILVRFGAIKSKRLTEPSIERNENWCSLLNICTDPNFVGSGIGTALMKAFEQEARNRGYQTIRLSVHNGNDPAIALYKKCGWEVILQNERGIYFKKIIG